VSRHTAVFRYSHPMPLELLLAAMPDLGDPVPKHVFEGTDILRNEYNTAPIGTGPFKFVEYQRGQYLIAKRKSPHEARYGLRRPCRASRRRRSAAMWRSTRW
jgi:peptide/nickel transport system substrate-binding protein